MKIELEDLPKLKELFQTLQSGYHLSNEDFGLYHELQDKEGYYEALFRELGYTLKADQRGYYYFLPEPQVAMNVTTRRMALLVFVLIEYLADEGMDPYTGIARGNFSMTQITSGLFSKHADILRDGGLDSPESIEKSILNNFVGLGFATVNGDELRFRPPVNRFLDVCLELGRARVTEENDSKTEAAGGAVTAEEPDGN
ncbi:MAG: hypothetical protein A3K19_14390 [Lentisphaerae bacterium RIFOXYB12_FULL_65_16]|nr:MAG: hypothetical protein A3K18_18435 [Lentisphaerae bacterium RIFOXYA12_64_32]OGV87412.1 MAG: hypothetical protein A3K19_14390 [Lentisphaerae bacterium RIFOXYB12_FULL_65_16]